MKWRVKEMIDVEREGGWQSRTLCDLGVWHVPCPAESWLALCLSPSHSLPPSPVPSLLLLSLTMPLKLKLSLLLTRTTQTHFWHLLPASLILLHPCLLLYFSACGNCLLFPTSSSLTHSSLWCLPASHPLLIVSKNTYKPCIASSKDRLTHLLLSLSYNCDLIMHMITF